MGEVVPLKRVMENVANGMNLSSTARSHICPRCGKPVAPLEVAVLGKLVQVSQVCDECVARDQAERVAEAERARKSRVEALFALAELGPRFQSCTFERWIRRPGTEDWYKAAREYVDHWDRYSEVGQGLLVFGPPGNGKTHLAAAIVNELIATRQAACIFRSVPALLAKLRSVYDESARVTEQEMFQVLRDADLVVLDDFGAEKLTEWAEATLYGIIDDRYRWMKPVIVTTNCDLDEFADRVGLRMFDRLLEMCMVVRNTGTSYRQEQAKQRLGRRQS